MTSEKTVSDSSDCSGHRDAFVCEGWRRALPFTQWCDGQGVVLPFLERTRMAMAGQAKEFVPEVGEVCEYALESVGKLLRSGIVWLSYLGCGGNPGDLKEEVVRAAVVVEMMHLSSLVHDDVIDGADLRRSKPTVSRKWGNRTAVLVGDCLLSQVACLSLSFRDEALTEIILNCAKAVCIGECLQSIKRSMLSESRDDAEMEEYLRILQLKTGKLFALAGELGARLAILPQNRQGVDSCDSMREFGLAFGTAYQLYDDCVDIFGSTIKTGKTGGIDLCEGKKTLPVLLLERQLREAGNTAEDALVLRELLQNWQPEKVDQLRGLLHKYSILEDCRGSLMGYLDKARSCLSALPGQEGRQGLENLLVFLEKQFDIVTN